MLYFIQASINSVAPQFLYPWFLSLEIKTSRRTYFIVHRVLITYLYSKYILSWTAAWKTRFNLRMEKCWLSVSCAFVLQHSQYKPKPCTEFCWGKISLFNGGTSMKEQQRLIRRNFLMPFTKLKNINLLFLFRFAQLIVSHIWDIWGRSAKIVRLLNKHSNVSLFLVKIYEKIKIHYLSTFHSDFADKVRAIVILASHNCQLKATVKRASRRRVMSATITLRL